MAVGGVCDNAATMPDTLVLSGDDVRAVLPMADCMEAVSAALLAMQRGEVTQPLRSMMPLREGRGILGVMPAEMAEPPVSGIKVISVVHGNHERGLDSHQGTVTLFAAEDGQPLAILDAASITAIRTAAASGVATRALANPDADDLALLGTGVQAISHLDAMRVARPLRRIRVWSRTPAHAERFAAEQAVRTGLEVRACASVEEAVDGASLMCTVTAAQEPIVAGRWLAPGCHVNAVGACTPKTREVDGEAVARATVYTDCRVSAEHEAGDLMLAIAEGRIGTDHLRGEIGDVLAGTLPGRSSPDEITLYESLGIGIFDLAAGHLAMTRARAAGRGTLVAL